MPNILFSNSPQDKNYTSSIIIPTWNNLPYLKLCLDSIYKNSVHTHQIIIHVNEGTDGTLEWLKDNFVGEVSYSKKNIGVCYAMNYARKLMITEYLLYLNDDMYVCPKWDYYLFEEIKKVKNKLFFFSGTLMQPGPFFDKSILAQANYGSRIEDFNQNKLLEEFENKTHNDWSGATWPPNVVHVDLWDAVGGYSVEFSPGMYSDPDFSMKLWKYGVRVFKGISKSRVYHFESISTKRVKKNDGAKKFLEKWGITSRTFGKYYLRRGEKFTGPLIEPKKSLAFYYDLIRSKIKLLIYKVF